MIEELAQRIAQTTSRTMPDVRSVLNGLDQAEIERLAKLDDVEFLKESVALMKGGGASISKIEVQGGQKSSPKKRIILPKPPGGGTAASHDPKAKATVSLAGVTESQKSENKISEAVLAKSRPKADAMTPEQSMAGQGVDFNDHTREINVAFQQQMEAELEDAPRFDKRAKILLGFFGGTAVVILLLLTVLVGMLLWKGGGPEIEEKKLKPWPLPKPAETVLTEHPWGYEIAGPIEQEIVRDDLFADDKNGLTLEMWVKISDLKTTRKIAIRNAGTKLQFELGCQQTKIGPKAYFMVPRATDGKKDRAYASFPDTDDWVHLCGVYDPRRENGLRLYINGNFAAHRKCIGKQPWLSALGYEIIVDQEEAATVALDEIRVSKGPAYKDNFEPKRPLSLTKHTRSLLHFDKHADGITIDARGNVQVPLKGGTFIATGPIVPVEVEIPAECPQDLWEAISETWTVEHANRFRDEWGKLSDDQKKLYCAGFKTGRWPRK